MNAQKIKAILKPLLLIPMLVAVVLSTLGMFIIIQVIQEALFVSDDYIMWVFKSPFSMLVYVFEFYIIFLLGYFFSKGVRENVKFFVGLKDGFLKRNKKTAIILFSLFNVILLYTIIVNVTIISKDKIVDYTFGSPFGTEYTLNDISIINTGIHGSGGLTKSKGDFFYEITLKKTTQVDLSKMGGSNDDTHPVFVIEQLDKQFVEAGIAKTSSLDNIELAKNVLAKEYTDAISRIIQNTK